MNEPIDDLPLSDLEQYGVYRNGELDLDPDELTALKRGHMTDLVELKNVQQQQGEDIDSLFARLSVVEEGQVNRLRVDPVYVDIKKHPLLNEQEQQELVSGQVANVRKTSLDSNGNENIEIIEYDKQTNQFMSYDPRKARVPDEVNGLKLSREQKKKLKEGEVVTLNDGTEIQLKTTDKSGINSNMKFLIFSVLLDGGLSFLAVTLANQLVSRLNQPQQEPASKNYREALIEAEKHLERQQAKHPNDPSITSELNQIKQAIERSEGMSAGDLNHRKSVSEKDIEEEVGFGADENQRPDTDTREGRTYGRGR